MLLEQKGIYKILTVIILDKKEHFPRTIPLDILSTHPKYDISEHTQRTWYKINTRPTDQRVYDLVQQKTTKIRRKHISQIRCGRIEYR